jgi:hypothetical protein
MARVRGAAAGSLHCEFILSAVFILDPAEKRVLRFSGSLVLRFSGSPVLRFSGSPVLWFSGSLTNADCFVCPHRSVQHTTDRGNHPNVEASGTEIGICYLQVSTFVSSRPRLLASWTALSIYSTYIPSRSRSGQRARCSRNSCASECVVIDTTRLSK